jgi:TonB family protein
MRNALTLAFASCFLVTLFSQGVGQQRAPQMSVAPADERSNREQDGLEGPVRRVRVETAKMIVRGGNVVEGPRVVRGIATYDSLGKKIDSVDYPVESSTVPGKERYRYDEKGNIVEMVVLGGDGSILSKEAYAYEFDPMGNWTKMSTSVAVYENGQVTFEPTEVTYRTLSYYYNQAIEKLSKNTAPPKRAAVPPASTTKADTLSGSTNNQPIGEPVSTGIKNSPTNPGTSSPPPIQNNDAIASEASVKKEVTAPVETVSKPPVAKMSEDRLRGAAIELPQPEYPQAALLARISGKVEVQLLINEKGTVTNARAQSGNALLTQAAEIAASKAKFLPAKLAPEPTLAFGVITYDFSLPETAPTPVTSIPSTDTTPRVSSERKLTIPSEGKTAVMETRPVSFPEAKPKAPEAERSNYAKGVAFLAAGNYEEAATLLKQVVQSDPNDANAYVKLAMSYSGMQRDKEAIAGYKMAAQIKASALDAAAYFKWGKSYLALDKNSDAISAFKQALSLMRAEAIGLEPTTTLMPSLEQVHHYMGTAYINSRRFGDSIKEFKQVVALNPANAEAHYALAIAYLSNGDREAAEAEHKILTSLDPALAKKIVSAFSSSSSRYGCRNIACR